MDHVITGEGVSPSDDLVTVVWSQGHGPSIDNTANSDYCNDRHELMAAFPPASLSLTNSRSELCTDEWYVDDRADFFRLSNLIVCLISMLPCWSLLFVNALISLGFTMRPSRTGLAGRSQTDNRVQRLSKFGAQSHVWLGYSPIRRPLLETENHIGENQSGSRVAVSAPAA